MPHEHYVIRPAGIFPPRAVAACRAVALIVGAALAGSALLLVLAVALSPAMVRPAKAQAPAAQAADPATPAGLYFRTGAADTALEAPSLSTDVQVAINGTVARVKVRQRFLNPLDAWVDGVYAFPVSDPSAVDRMEVTVGGRRIAGKIMPLASAPRALDVAASGEPAESAASGPARLFTIALSKIPPQEEIAVEIEYQEQVAYEDGRFALHFPLGLAKAAAPPRLAVTLDAGLPLRGIESLNHAVEIRALDSRRRTVTLTDAPPERGDFVLQWTPVVGSVPEVALFGEELDGASYVMAMLVPPSKAKVEPAPPRDLVLVVDTSGSMRSGALDQAKKAMLQAIARLGPEDRFNIVRFADDAHALFRSVRPASAANLRAAKGYIRNLHAEGGSALSPALARALGEPATPGRPRQVVLVSDGPIANETELFDYVAARLGEARLFTVGLGPAEKSAFLRKAAEFGRGAFVGVGRAEELGARLGALLGGLERRVLTDVRGNWTSTLGGEAEAYPDPAPDLYAGQPEILVAKIRGAGLADLKGEVHLAGLRGERDWERRVSLAEIRPAPGVAALWARDRIQRLEGTALDGRDAERVRAEILNIALRRRLVTAYTALVPVDETPVAQAEATAAESGEAERRPGAIAESGGGAMAAGLMPLRSLPPSLLQRIGTNTTEVGQPQSASSASEAALIGLGILAFGGILLLVALRRYHTGAWRAGAAPQVLAGDDRTASFDTRADARGSG